MGRMTAKQLAADRQVIGWSRVELAKRLNCDEGTIRAMENGRREIPPEVGWWLHPIATLVRGLEPPDPANWMVRVPSEKRQDYD